MKTGAVTRFCSIFVFSVWMAGCSASNISNQGGSASAYPLQVSPDGRYLVDQNENPFLIHGDSPQSLIVNLSESDAEFYFSNRQKAGFNSVFIHILCAGQTGGRADGSTYDGILPFTTPGDISTPNPAYFSRVDAMLRLAEKHNLLVFLDPAETIDWLDVLLQNGEMKAREYGCYLGERYRAFDNIIWLNGNDFQTWRDRNHTAVVQAVAQGIRENDDRHIQTVLLDFYNSGSLDDSSWSDIIRLNASYTYYPTYDQVLRDYNRTDFLPTFLAEGFYEFEREGTVEQNLRRQAYWALLSGAAGQLYGNGYTWQFSHNWKKHLDSAGSTQMQYVKTLFSSRAWYQLVPDQNHSFVVSGYGTYNDRGSIAENDYVTAAITADGTLGMAYLPTSRTVAVDMSRMSGSCQVRWYDPAAGRFLLISSVLPDNGIVEFTPRGKNGRGDEDWVLVIEVK